MGVFATRSPFRPNSLGLSSVKIRDVEHTADLGPIIRVCGADLMDGTPIYDVKPYVAYADAHPQQVPLITINSWNEWTETSYLEPDDLYGYGYLEAVRSVFLSDEE